MDFAPYQDSSPETHRAQSPPAAPRRSLSFSPPSISRGSKTSDDDPWRRNTASPPPPPPSAHPHSPRRSFSPAQGHGGRSDESRGRGEGGRGGGGGLLGRRDTMDAFETSTGLRLDVEAALAYLLLPPAGGVGLLLVEVRSDYVRFHAWQSSLLFTVLFVLHLIFSFSAVLSYMLLVCDLALMGFLAWRAFTDAHTLDRYEIPFVGRVANAILDDE